MVNRRSLALALVTLVALSAAVWAYTSSARNSLLKSRDQVADQRYQLERAYADLDRKIGELQQQQYNIKRYLTDCDRTLRDIDRALSAEDAGYRNMR